MAKTNQKLIHLHGNSAFTQADLIGLGEIVVRHGADAPELYIKKSDNTLAEFVDKAAVAEMVRTGATTAVTELSAATMALSAATVAIDADYLRKIKKDDAGDGEYVALTIGEKDGKEQTIKANLTLGAFTLSASTHTDSNIDLVKVTATNGVAKAQDVAGVAQRLATQDVILEGMVNAEVDARKAAINGLNANLTAKTASEQIQVELKEVSGVVTEIKVTADTLALSADTVAEEDARKAADENLDTKIGELSAGTIADIAAAKIASSAYTDYKVEALSGDTKAAIEALSANTEAAIEAAKEDAEEASSAYTDYKVGAESARTDAAIAQAKVDASAYTDYKVGAESARTDAAIEAAKVASSAYTDYKIGAESARTDAAIAAAKATIDAYTVNGMAISENPVLDGADIKLDGYAKAESAAAIATGDTVNAALGKLEFKADNGLDKVISGNGISVSEKANKEQSISIKIKDNEKVLGVDADGLNSTLSISYNSADRKIYLKGINDAEVSSFDASAFVKDGILYGQTIFKATATTQSVTIKGQTNEFSGLTVGHQYLAMCFSNGEASGTTYTWEILDVNDLVDVYKGDGKTIEVDSANTISVKANVFDEKGAAASALTDAKKYIDNNFATSADTVAAIEAAKVASSAYTDDKIAALDAEVSGKSANEQIEVKVEQEDGKLKAVTVTAAEKFALSADTVAEEAARIAADAALLGDATATTTSGANIYDVKRWVASAYTVIESNERVTAAAFNAVNTNINNLSAGTIADIAAAKVASSAYTDYKIAAESARTDAAIEAAKVASSAYTDFKVADEIAKLDAVVSGMQNEIKVQVSEVDGKITEVAVEAPVFLKGVQLNGTDLTVDENKKVNVTALQEVNIKSGAEAGVSATTADNKTTFDFSGLVIDCGTYDEE